MLSSFATLEYSEDFETGWTAGFNYGEFVANKWICLDGSSPDIDCSPSGTLGVGGIAIVDEASGPKFLRIYSTYDNVNSNTKTGDVFLNLSTYDIRNWSSITELGISYNMRPQDYMLTYSDTNNRFTIMPYKVNEGATPKFTNYLNCLPASTYCGITTNWDSDDHNGYGYPFTYTPFYQASGAIDEAFTGEFDTHGNCFIDEDEWGTMYARFYINNTGGDTNGIYRIAYYVNGNRCYDENLSGLVYIQNYQDGGQLLAVRFYAKNMVYDIDNLRIYTYNVSDSESDIIWDVMNDSVNIEEGSEYTPSDSEDASANPLDAIFGNYSDSAAMFISLILIVTLAFLGWKFAGFYGGTLGGILGIISSTIFGWLPGWVLFVLILLIAAMFAKKLAVD